MKRATWLCEHSSKASPRTYTGNVGWTDLYDSVGSKPAYVDVHTTDHPGGQLRGALRVETPAWQTFARAYRS